MQQQTELCGGIPVKKGLGEKLEAQGKAVAKGTLGEERRIFCDAFVIA